MKKLLLGLALLLGSIHTAYGDVDMAKLKIKFTGPVNNNAYFLCVSNNGCSSISAAAKGKIYLVDTGSVNYIFAASMKNFTMISQPLPPSCQVTLSKDQTLTVSGKLLVKDESPYIGNLKCSVT